MFLWVLFREICDFTSKCTKMCLPAGISVNLLGSLKRSPKPFSWIMGKDKDKEQEGPANARVSAR